MGWDAGLDGIIRSITHTGSRLSIITTEVLSEGAHDMSESLAENTPVRTGDAKAGWTSHSATAAHYVLNHISYIPYIKKLNRRPALAIRRGLVKKITARIHASLEG